MKNRPAVSVIVAVYMAEAYIDRCMQSLLCQTLTDIEIILVDDGSPDRSGEICDRYAAADSRIKVIHKPNGGVSSARQSGIETMTGEYSIHVDPDDWIDPDMFETMYRKAKSEDLDIVVCGMVIEYPDHSEYRSESFDGKNRNELNRLFLNHKLFPGLANKLIKSELYRRLHIRFPEKLMWGEDYIVGVRMFHSDSRIGFENSCPYHYVRSVNENSLSVKYNNSDAFRQFVNCYDDLKKMFVGSGNMKILNESVTYLAHNIFFYHNISAIDGVGLFFKHIPKFINSFSPIHRKVNLILAALGLSPAAKYIYSKLKHLYGRKEY